MKSELAEKATALLTATLYEALSEETRRELITDSMKALVEKKSRHGQEQPSTLEEAFRDALFAMTRKIVGEVVSKDEELKTEVERVATEAVQKWIVSSKDALIGKIAIAIGNAIYEEGKTY